MNDDLLLRIISENGDFESLSENQKFLLRQKIRERLAETSPEAKPEITEEQRLDQYTSMMKKLKLQSEREALYEQDLLSGLDNPATLADIKKSNTDLWLRVQQSLASVGGGGLGQHDVEQVVNTTVINNFGLTPLDSSGSSSTFDSDDVVVLVDSDYVQQRLPQDVKVRFRLDATTPVVLNSSGVTSVTTFQSGQNAKYDINFDTPFASADDYITMLTLDQEGVDRTTTLIPPVNAESRTPVVISQSTGSVRVAVEKVDTADNQDEGVLNVKVFKF